MNFIINILVLILIIAILYNFLYSIDHFELVTMQPEINNNLNNVETDNKINFMFYQGTKPANNPISVKNELNNNLNDLIKTALSLPDCIAFTNNGEFYSNNNLCYNKGVLNLIKGDGYEGTYVKSSILEDYIINVC